jgi:hypothetical protein
MDVRPTERLDPKTKEIWQRNKEDLKKIPLSNFSFCPESENPSNS